ncbi:hypothetical protein HY627_02270 [Candidatus Uhrbacteria bacterium]|nr:hypothetical protein [Candidatus Uhrbacteria bacterium]
MPDGSRIYHGVPCAKCNNPTTKHAPTNTAKQITKHPIVGVIEGMLHGSSSMILNQEAEGQRQIVNSDVLPTLWSYGKEALEQAGVKFLDVVEGDELFQNVELPPGWRKEATSHSMWSNLLDDKGRIRATFFYKAAFYDRRADIRAANRYGYAIDYERSGKEGVCVAQVKDCGTVVFETKPLTLSKNPDEFYPMQDKALGEAEDWLNQNYPDWSNPGSYWGD